VTRTVLGALALAAVGLCPGGEPAPAAEPRAGVPVELVLLGDEKLARIAVHVEVDGVSVSTIWDETFAKLFAYFDRDGNGALDAGEVARLPSARALHQAMATGFTPPIGPAPAVADLDRNGDGKASPDELGAFYRAAGLGNARIGVGRLPASAQLAGALLKALDTDGDGRVREAEWNNAAKALAKFDRNDDELIGADELVLKTVYPGAAGTVILTPPVADLPVPDVVAKLPLVLLPTAADANWASVIVKRDGRFRADDLTAARKRDAIQWVVKLTGGPGGAERFALRSGRLKVDGWVAAGKAGESLASARERFAPPAEPEKPDPTRNGLAWLVPIADRNGDGKLDGTERDAWLDLQAQIARGQAFVTLLDGGGLFELLDANHDGALSPRELRNALEVLNETGCVTNGALDPNKVPRVLFAVASRGYPRALALDSRRGPVWFRAMDKNGDGDVSRREFTGPLDVFEKLDRDKDGLLSAEEAGKAEIRK
jgi:Ca2+-binding EF-hand superfamily protein